MFIRMLRGALDQPELERLYETTRVESGFNAYLYARVTTPAGVSVLIGHNEYRVDQQGRSIKHHLSNRRARMVELGFSEQIVAAFPDDEPHAG